MNMMCRPKWPFLHMYGSHDVRHVEFRGLTGSQRTPRIWGVTLEILDSPVFIYIFVSLICMLLCFSIFSEAEKQSNIHIRETKI